MLNKHESQLSGSKSDQPQQPAYCKNATAQSNRNSGCGRICTHLGCSPTYRKEVGAADLVRLAGRLLLPMPRSRFDWLRACIEVPGPASS